MSIDQDKDKKRIRELEQQLSERDDANSRLAIANKQLTDQLTQQRGHDKLITLLSRHMREYEKWGARGNTLGNVLDLCRKLCRYS